MGDDINRVDINKRLDGVVLYDEAMVPSKYMLASTYDDVDGDLVVIKLWEAVSGLMIGDRVVCLGHVNVQDLRADVNTKQGKRLLPPRESDVERVDGVEEEDNTYELNGQVDPLSVYGGRIF